MPSGARSNVVESWMAGPHRPRHRIGRRPRVDGQGFEVQRLAPFHDRVYGNGITRRGRARLQGAGLCHTVAPMTLTRREALQLGAAAALAPVQSLAAQTTSAPPATPRIRVAVSTYSYWHFEPVKYPIEKVIDDAAAMGFDGVEILHRQMESETPAYVSGLRQRAFRNGLDLVMLSIHQDFVSPDAAERKKDVDHTDPLHPARQRARHPRHPPQLRAAGTRSSPSTTS